MFHFDKLLRSQSGDFDREKVREVIEDVGFRNVGSDLLEEVGGIVSKEGIGLLDMLEEYYKAVSKKEGEEVEIFYPDKELMNADWSKEVDDILIPNKQLKKEEEVVRR